MSVAVAALVSGGLDSMVLVATLARRWRVIPVYIRQGLRWETAEQYWLRRWLAVFPRRQVAPLVTLMVPASDLYGQHWSVSGRVPRASDPDAAVWLPGRNLLLLAKAVVYCAQHRIPTIALGTLKGNPFADAGPTFRRQISQVASLALGGRIQVIAPLATLTKSQVIRRGRGLPLHLTFSCIDPDGRQPCGRCQKCGERRRGLQQA